MIRERRSLPRQQQTLIGAGNRYGIASWQMS